MRTLMEDRDGTDAARKQVADDEFQAASQTLNTTAPRKVHKYNAAEMLFANQRAGIHALIRIVHQLHKLDVTRGDGVGLLDHAKFQQIIANAERRNAVEKIDPYGLVKWPQEQGQLHRRRAISQLGANNGGMGEAVGQIQGGVDRASGGKPE